MKKKKYLFIGPSLGKNDLSKIELQDFILMSPIKRGDIFKILEKKPIAIGIVDGFFFNKPSVLHQEILLALSLGIQILGSSSMGALRAAEMESTQMIGVGEVYNLYRAGAIDGDDEVAILHLEEAFDYYNVTFPLVELRITIDQIIRKDNKLSKVLLDFLSFVKSHPFQKRELSTLLEVFDSKMHLELKTLLEANWVNQKQLDALLLIKKMRAIRPVHTHNIYKPEKISSWSELIFQQKKYGGAFDDYKFLLISKAFFPNFIDLQNDIFWQKLVINTFNKHYVEHGVIFNNIFEKATTETEKTSNPYLNKLDIQRYHFFNYKYNQIKNNPEVFTCMLEIIHQKYAINENNKSGVMQLSSSNFYRDYNELIVALKLSPFYKDVFSIYQEVNRINSKIYGNLNYTFLDDNTILKEFGLDNTKFLELNRLAYKNGYRDIEEFLQTQKLINGYQKNKSR